MSALLLGATIPSDGLRDRETESQAVTAPVSDTRIMTG